MVCENEKEGMDNPLTFFTLQYRLYIHAHGLTTVYKRLVPNQQRLVPDQHVQFSTRTLILGRHETGMQIYQPILGLI